MGEADQPRGGRAQALGHREHHVDGEELRGAREAPQALPQPRRPGGIERGDVHPRAHAAQPGERAEYDGVSQPLAVTEHDLFTHIAEGGGTGEGALITIEIDQRAHGDPFLAFGRGGRLSLFERTSGHVNPNSAFIS